MDYFPLVETLNDLLLKFNMLIFKEVIHLLGQKNVSKLPLIQAEKQEIYQTLSNGVSIFWELAMYGMSFSLG